MTPCTRGSATSTAPVRAALYWAGATKATPDVSAMADAKWSTVVTPPGPGMATATTKGPLKPGPNPWAKRS